LPECTWAPYGAKIGPGVKIRKNNDLLSLARAWVHVQKNWWAYDEVQDAVENHPRKAWALLSALADLAASDELIDDLGAGPLEDFVRVHAPKFIGQIEQRAAEHERFRRALRSVRLPRANDPVSRRLLALGCRPMHSGGLEPWQRA
jgi:hypothetical protein